jgi:uncharacterized RDD family membrane protein YckC
VAAAVGVIVWQSLPPDLEGFALPLALVTAMVGGSFLFAIYTLAGEVVYGRTVGKALFGMRVVRESGARISFGQQRAFELLSKTRVVRA